MKKIHGLILTLLCLSVQAFAQQTGTVTATLSDAVSGEGIPGAVISMSLKSAAANVRPSYFTAGFRGAVSFAVPYGDYDMIIAFIGYDSLRMDVNVNRATVPLGALSIKQSTIGIESVVLSVPAMRTSQRGDTTIYNAESYQVTRDADTETLLAKMPGITIQDGEVTAQGEIVQRVTVDGREFFGDDVTATIRNLPAEIVESIEVYTRLSDNAEFTGIDDGDSYRAINIVTREDKRVGAFGKVSLGYGFDDKYMNDASLNIFRGNHRITLTGQYNNVGRQNFSSMDFSSGRGGMMMGGGGGGGGLSTIKSGGVNYTGVLNPKMQLQMSYQVNSRDNERTTDYQQWYFSQDELGRYREESATSTSGTISHRIMGRYDYRINQTNNLTFRPELSFQTQNSLSAASGSNSNYNISTGEIVNLLNRVFNGREDNNDSYDVSGRLNYQHRFPKAGRTLVTQLSVQADRNMAIEDRESNTTTYPAGSDSLLIQHVIDNGSSLRLIGSLTYTEPLTTRAQFIMQYNGSYSKSDGDRKSYLDWVNDQLNYDPLYSNIMNSGYLRQSIGPGYRFNNGSTNVVFSLNYQYSSLMRDQELPVIDLSQATAYFNNITYSSTLRTSFGVGNNLRVNLQSSTNNPSIGQLQNVVDMSDPQRVSTGNPELVPSYRNNLNISLNRSVARRGQTIGLNIGASVTTNSITNSLVTSQGGDQIVIQMPDGEQITLQPNAQFSRPVNMGGTVSVSANVSFGTPVRLLGSNVNFDAGLSRSNSPSYINGEKNMSGTTRYSAGVSINSNISSNLDFTLRYNTGYNTTHNTIHNTIRSNNNNEYWTQSAYGRFKWITWKGFTLSGNASYSMNRGITNDYSIEYMLVNLTIGKKIFRSQLGEINFGVNDLLDQNRSFSRRVGATYVENSNTNVLRRYYGISFTYNIRQWGASYNNTGSGGGGNRGGDGQRPPQGGFQGGPPPQMPAGGFQGGPPAGGVRIEGFGG